MPTYAYRCPACGHEFDVFQKMSDAPGAACPRCGAAAERVITGGSGVLFRGGGFYQTDYRSESYKKAAKSESGDAGGTKAEGGAAAAKPEAGGAKTGESGGAKGGGESPTSSSGPSKPKTGEP